MANIIFSETSGVNDPIFGKFQAPIKAMIMDYAEPFEKESMLNTLFAMEKSEHFAESYNSMTTMENWEPVGENGSHPTNGFEAGPDKLIHNYTWKSQFSISQEMIEDTNFAEIRRQPRAFTKAYYRTREELGAAMYGGAISGKKTVQIGAQVIDITGADGEALFSTSHKAYGSGKAKAQSNKFSDAVSNDAILYMESMMQNFTDDNGNLLDIRPDTILIPNLPAVKKEVFAALGADKDPDTANNGFNYNYGRFNIIVWGYLNRYVEAGTAPWVMLDSNFAKDYFGAVFQDRTAMTVRSVVEENDANTWYGRARFGAGFTNFRFAAVGGAAGGTSLIGT